MNRMLLFETTGSRFQPGPLLIFFFAAPNLAYRPIPKTQTQVARPKAIHW